MYFKTRTAYGSIRPADRFYHTFLGRGNWSPNYPISIFYCMFETITVFNHHHTMIQVQHINEVAILDYVSITVWCVGGFSSSSFTLVLYIIFNQDIQLNNIRTPLFLYSKRKYAEIKLSYNVLRTLITILLYHQKVCYTILHILMQ